MNDIKQLIKDLVDKETNAWNTQNIKELLSLFHPDMVWIWPPNNLAHDPLEWVFGMGRFDYQRWGKIWQDLFDNHSLIHNRREIKKIEVSDNNDGAFAVVDIDTLWKDNQGNNNHWKGRVCKVFTKVNDDWKIIMHTGVLLYDLKSNEKRKM